MPRYARAHAPGALVHVIARFVNHQFRLTGATERAAVLERIPKALARSDWSLCAYALMSTHIHLALLAGTEPPWRFLKPLHISLAKWLNQAHGTFGPVFAERATTVVMAPERMAALAAYLHNNPVRARLFAQAADSDWTSHRAWVGRDPSPDWLAVEPALQLAGFGTTEQGRLEFDRFVRARAHEARDPQWSEGGQRQVRRQVRAVTGLPLELASRVEPPGADARYLLVSPAPLPLPRWQGELTRLLAQVSSVTGVSVAELCSRSHRPGVVTARRLALTTGSWFLRRDLKEVAALLGISAPSASRLLRRADDVLPVADEIARALRSG